MAGPGGHGKTVARTAARGTAARRKPGAHRPASPRALAQRAQVRERIAAGPSGPGAIQPSLIVGPANDPAEHEADRMASTVLTMPAPGAAAPPSTPKPDGVGALRRDGGQPNLDEFETTPPVPADQVDPEVAAEEDVDTEGLDEGDIAEVETGEPEGGGDEGGGGGNGGESEAIQAKPAVAVGTAGGPAPAEAAAHVAAPGPGRPLPGSLRGFMEPRFGADFSAVRLYDQAPHRQTARRLGARAFTHKKGIWLGPGEEASDKRLMAHELTHVVQQNPGVKAKAEETDAPRPEISRRADATVRRGAIADKIESYARKVPGYTLIEVILGKSPITGDRVERNATNFIGGILDLIGMGDVFRRMQEARVLERAYEWVVGQLSSLNITWARFVAAAEKAWDDFSLIDLSLEPVYAAFRPLVRDVKTFCSRAWTRFKELLIEGALALFGPIGKKIWGFIKKAGDIIGLIFSDPVGFAANLFKAIYKGFSQFGSNIVQHVKQGLMDWLFGTLGGLSIEMPAKLDFKGMISIGLQVVGLTYQNFRAILVKKLGKGGERKVSLLEKGISFVTTLATEGFAGVWRKALEYIENFKQTVIDGIKTWVRNTIITQAVAWAAKLSNPAGSIIAVLETVYNAVKTFLERMNDIIDLVNAIFDSLGRIARGDVSQAANFIETAMAKTIPVIINFLARILKINKIVDAIRDIIKKLRAPVEKAMNKFVGFIVKKAKKFLAKIIAKINGKRKMPGETFKVGKTEHRLYAKKTGAKVGVYVASEETEAKTAAKRLRGDVADTEEGGTSRTESTAVADQLDGAADEAQAKAASVKPADATKSSRKPTDALTETLRKHARLLDTAGKKVEDNPDLKTDDPKHLIRAIEPRFDNEGQVGVYKDIKKTNAAPAPGTGLPYSTYYEADHLPEKSLLQAIKAMLAAKADGAAAEKAAADKPNVPPAPPVRDVSPDGQGAEAKPPPRPLGFGQLADLADEPGGNGDNLMAITLHRPIHRAKKNTYAADSLKKIDAIKATDPAERERQIKQIVEDQIKAETADVKALYKADPNAVGAIRKNVYAGLDGIVAQANTLYNLAAKPEPHEDKDVTAPGAAGAVNPLAFAGPNDFDDKEGIIDAYGRMENTGPFFERDHIIDKSYPLGVKAMTLEDPVLWDKSGLEAEADKAKEGKPPAQKGVVTRRLNALRATRLFPEGKPMAGYTEYNGTAMMMFRPIHRRVTAETAPRNAKLEATAAVGAGHFDAAKGYLTGDRSDATGTVSAIRQTLRKSFTDQAKRHSGSVGKHYEQEKPRVRAANPGRETAALRVFEGVVGRVHANLRKMQTATFDLFG